MNCKKCGGIIPDIMVDIRDDRNDCKNHSKPEITIPLKYF